MRQCVFLQQQGQTPAQLFEDFVEKGDIAPLVPYSCQLCHQCTVVCPHHLELADAFLAIRQDMVQANHGHTPLKQMKGVELHQLLSRFALFCYTKKG
jgi:L-lactate utilization protein LutB